MLFLWLMLVFVLGACVGCVLNVCIYRLPYEKSLFWPGWRCGRCYQPIRWYDALPLLGWWLRRGRCRACGRPFPVRYFLIELFTALAFAGLFQLAVVRNVHGWELLRDRAADVARGDLPWEAWVLFGHHALLFCLLLVASFIDLDHYEIPLGLTVTGTALGLLGSVLWPWPWPAPASAAAVPEHQWAAVFPTHDLPTGLYPWPVWGPLPEWLPAGSWQLGLATGVAGLLAGLLLLRLVRFLFTTGLGIEAMGVGDADLMMMAGSFLGWQPVMVAFVVGVFPGLFFALAYKVFQWLAASRKVAVRLLAVQPDGQPALLVQGQEGRLDRLEETLKALHAERPRTGVLLDVTALDEWVRDSLLALEQGARQAGVPTVEVVDKTAHPSLWQDLGGLLLRLLRPPATAVEAKAVHDGGRPLLLVDGRRLPPEEMAGALSELLPKGGEGRLRIDPAPLGEVPDRCIAAVQAAADRAGLPQVQLMERSVPFGPGLSVGVMIVLLGWQSIGPGFRFVFFNGPFIIGLVIASGLFMLGASYLLRLMRPGRR